MLIRTVSARSALAGLGLLMAVSLSGCVSPGGDPLPTIEPTNELPTPTHSTPATTPPSPTPSDTAAPPEKPTPVSIPCNSVVDAQTMYDFNPNYGLLNSFTPAAGSLIAQAADAEGTVCRWLQQTSGVTIDIGISKPGSTALAAARAAAESGTAVNGLADAAYFSTTGGPGTIQAFETDTWIVVTSVAFGAASDAHDLVKSAVAAAR